MHRQPGVGPVFHTASRASSTLDDRPVGRGAAMCLEHVGSQAAFGAESLLAHTTLPPVVIAGPHRAALDDKTVHRPQRKDGFLVRDVDAVLVSEHGLDPPLEGGRGGLYLGTPPLPIAASRRRPAGIKSGEVIQISFDPLAPLALSLKDSP